MIIGRRKVFLLVLLELEEFLFVLVIIKRVGQFILHHQVNSARPYDPDRLVAVGYLQDRIVLIQELYNDHILGDILDSEIY